MCWLLPLRVLASVALRWRMFVCAERHCKNSLLKMLFGAMEERVLVIRGYCYR